MTHESRIGRAVLGTTLTLGVVVGLAGCGGGNVTGPGNFGGPVGGGGNPGGNGDAVGAIPAQQLTQLQTVAADFAKLPPGGALSAGDKQTLASLQTSLSSYIANNPSSNGAARAGLGLVQLALLESSASANLGACAQIGVFNLGSPRSAVTAAANVQGLRDTLTGEVKNLALTKRDTSGCSISTVVSGLSGSLTLLKQASANLTTASNISGVSFKLFNTQSSSTLSQADLKLLAGGLNALTAAVEIGTAYNVDPGSFYSNVDFSNPQSLLALDKNHDFQLTPNEYLAPAPFLTITPNGKSNLADALVQLKAATAAISAGITAKKAEGTNNQDAVNIDDATLTTDASFLPTINSFLQGPAPVPNSPIGNVNISAFLNNPVSDFRTALPTISIAQNPPTIVGGPYTVNGLFPQGIPISVINSLA